MGQQAQEWYTGCVKFDLSTSHYLSHGDKFAITYAFHSTSLNTEVPFNTNIRNPVIEVRQIIVVGNNLHLHVHSERDRIGIQLLHSEPSEMLRPYPTSHEEQGNQTLMSNLFFLSATLHMQKQKHIIREFLPCVNLMRTLYNNGRTHIISQRDAFCRKREKGKKPCHSLLLPHEWLKYLVKMLLTREVTLPLHSGFLRQLMNIEWNLGVAPMRSCGHITAFIPAPSTLTRHIVSSPL